MFSPLCLWQVFAEPVVAMSQSNLVQVLCSGGGISPVYEKKIRIS